MDVMRRVAGLLRTHGAHVWVDENLEVGSDDWKKIVERAISESTAMVAILSPDAKGSDWVLAEISRAKMNEVRVFPLLIRGEPRDSIPFGLENANWFDARTNLHARTAIFAQDVCKQLGITSTENLIRQVKQLERQLQERKEAEAALRQQIEDRDKVVETLRSQLRQRETNIRKLEDNVRTLQGDNVNLQDELQQLRSLAPEPDSEMAKFLTRYNTSKDMRRVRVHSSEDHSITDHVEFASLYTLVKMTESEIERTSQMFALAQEVPKLKPYSIMSWFTLLWWYFFRPVQLKRHRQLYGDDSLVQVQSWLASTLIWGALLIPLLGAALGTIDIRDDITLMGQSLASPIWVAGALAGWLVMGYFGRRDGDGLGFNLALLGIGAVTGLTAFAIVLAIPLDLTVALAFFAVVGVLFAIQGIAAFLLAFAVTFILASSMTLGLPSISLLGTGLIGSLVIAALIGQVIGKQQEHRLISLHTILSTALFSGFMGTYIFLASVYWLGGFTFPV